MSEESEGITLEKVKKEEKKEKEEKEEKEEKKEKEENSGNELKKQAQTYIEYFFEFILRTIFFWEKDPKRLGTLIRFCHHATVYLLIISFFVIHTIIPSFFLLCLYTIFWFFLWIHHILTGGCVVSKIEQSLLGDSKSFIDPFLQLFHIPISKETTVGATIMGSTFILFFLTMEISARTSIYIKSLFS